MVIWLAKHPLKFDIYLIHELFLNFCKNRKQKATNNENKLSAVTALSFFKLGLLSFPCTESRIQGSASTAVSLVTSNVIKSCSEGSIRINLPRVALYMLLYTFLNIIEDCFNIMFQLIL